MAKLLLERDDSSTRGYPSLSEFNLAITTAATNGHAAFLDVLLQHYQIRFSGSLDYFAKLVIEALQSKEDSIVLTFAAGGFTLEAAKKKFFKAYKRRGREILTPLIAQLCSWWEYNVNGNKEVDVIPFDWPVGVKIR